MSLRRIVPALLASLAIAGCKEVTQSSPPAQLVVAAFNSRQTPTASSPSLPTPNDLALAAAAGLPPSAQRALLEAFVGAGGFPSDQAVGITIPLKHLVWDAGANRYVLQATPPDIDPATVTTQGGAPTLVVLKIDGPAPVAVAVELDPDATSTGARSSPPGQLALRKARSASGSRAWAPGRYVFAMRGGPGGVRTRTGLTVDADQAIALAIPNLDLRNPNNQPPGGLDPSLAAAADSVRTALWNPVDWNAVGGRWAPTGASPISAFAAVQPFIPPAEVAVIGTFEIAPSAAAAPVDSGSGIAPLPLDLLRTGPASTTCAGGNRTVGFNASFGPAAAGLTTLDGFSTTAMVFAPVTFPVDAGTVNGSTVHLFKRTGGTWTRLLELKEELGKFAASSGALGNPAGAAYVAEPDPITVASGATLAPGLTCPLASRCATLIGLQPAVGAPVGAPFGTIYLPPLDEGTDYAVVITTGVKTILGQGLARSSIGKILLGAGFDPVATATGASLLAGVSDPTAAALQAMRRQLLDPDGVVSSFVAATGRAPADVAMAYTFRTQGCIRSTALGLVQVPYGAGAGIAPDPDAVATYTPQQVAADYGVDPSVLPTAGPVAELAEVKFRTVSWLLGSLNQGAFDPAHPATETVTALVAVPAGGAAIGACPSVGAPFVAYDAPNGCAPLVVFEHGLGSSKAQLLPVAGALAAAGFVVAAADLPMHGERSYCSGSGPSAQAAANAMCCPAAFCGTAHTCAFKANLTTPVDVDQTGAPIQIGVCESAAGVRGRMANHRLDSDVTPSPKGTAFASGNRLVSLNFFRVRDALRQDAIDVSALVKALAPIGKSADAFAAYLQARHGLAVDHTRVYWLGHSAALAAGAPTLAANPRVTRAVGYGGGATTIDVFANPASSFNATLNAMLAGAGIQPGTPDYLKLLQIGKWILDPAEPANYARSVVPATAAALPSPFALPPFDATPLAALWPTQPTREVLTQISLCDGTVPNAQNTLLSALLGRRDDGTSLAGYAVPAAATATTGRVQWFTVSGAATCPADAVSHSNPWTGANASLAAKAQAAMASFLAAPANAVTPVVQ